jgi:hypothetical protein
MPTYRPSEYDMLEYTEDLDPAEGSAVWINVNFIEPSECTFTVEPIRQPVNRGEQATAIKSVEGEFLLFDGVIKSSLETLEQSHKPAAWRLRNIDGSYRVMPHESLFSIGEEVTTDDGMQGYQILLSYRVGYAADALETETPA